MNYLDDTSSLLLLEARSLPPRILPQTLDCHSVPVMTIKFFNLQFEVNSSVSHLEMMIASNAQQSQENSNGWERDHHTWVCTSSARYIPLILELRKSFSVLNTFSFQKFGLEIIEWKTTLPMYVQCMVYCIYSGFSIIRIAVWIVVCQHNLNTARISDLVQRSEQSIKSYCFTRPIKARYYRSSGNFRL